jgi:hypothetical protein
MAGLSTTTLILLATLIYVAILGALIRFMRPGKKRVGGAFAGGAVAALIGAGIEAVVHRQELWQYTDRQNDTQVGPLLAYPFVVVNFAIIALIGWRIDRRFGIRGQAVLVAALALMGVARDYFESGYWLGQVTHKSGILPFAVDIGSWTLLSSVALAVMWRVAGPSEMSPPNAASAPTPS